MTLNPSQEPSENPIVEPSESPTLYPTEASKLSSATRVPSKGSPSRIPMSIPTIFPAITTTEPPQINYDIVGNDLNIMYHESSDVGNYRYVVNATGYFGIVPDKGKSVLHCTQL